MQVYYLNGMNPKDVEKRWRKHKNWTWRQWQDQWEKSGDLVDLCVALTLEEKWYNGTG